MKHSIKLALGTLALAVASTGAFALGDKRDKGQPNTRTTTSSQSSGQSADKNAQGSQGSTTTTEASKTPDRSLKQEHDLEGGTGTSAGRGRIPTEDTKRPQNR